MDRSLKFWIYKVEVLYYLYRENKGADQLRGYREADLRLDFRICKNPVFIRHDSFRSLSVPFPNLALIDVGASCLAIAQSVGPIRFRHFDTAPSPISSMAMIGPRVTKFNSLLKTIFRALIFYELYIFPL